MRLRFAIPILLLVLSSPLLAIDAGEYAARRAKLASAVGAGGMVVILPSENAVRHGGTEWPFRQSDEILYLTGIDVPGTALALVPSESKYSEVLFIPQSNPLREVWTGALPTHEEASRKSGVAEVHASKDLDSFVAVAIQGLPFGDSTTYGYYRTPATPEYLKAVRNGSASIWLLLGDGRTLRSAGSPEQTFASHLADSFPEIRIRNASPLLDSMREIKSPAEIALIQRAIDITAAAQKAAMKRALTAESEHEIQATIEFVFRDRGACCPGFPSIVAAGRNATTLHYESNEAPIVRDGLVLTDIGAEVEGYTADMTRTYPADGTFSPEQREIYEAVLAAQNEAMTVMRPGGSLLDAHNKALGVLGRKLLATGLITRNEPAQVEMYYRHGLGHPLGLEVHDTFDRTRKFEPGMVVTDEPGLYIREADVQASKAYKGLTAEEQKSIDAALKRFGGIGVRIEDDVLITNREPKLLSGAAPRTVEEVERWMREAK